MALGLLEFDAGHRGVFFLANLQELGELASRFAAGTFHCQPPRHDRRTQTLAARVIVLGQGLVGMPPKLMAVDPTVNGHCFCRQERFQKRARPVLTTGPLPAGSLTRAFQCRDEGGNLFGGDRFAATFHLFPSHAHLQPQEAAVDGICRPRFAVGVAEDGTAGMSEHGSLRDSYCRIWQIDHAADPLVLGFGLGEHVSWERLLLTHSRNLSMVAARESAETFRCWGRTASVGTGVFLVLG
ncbi:MAG TPA: hypothetical protein VE890_13260 [Thermoguttaceae bacterium]|nr:hypothetical protein [Thermoguttaceae bacterium]